MKKVILLIIFIGLLGGCSYQNEVFFKRYNKNGIENFQAKNYPLAREDFQKAASFFTDWSLITDNNISATLYEEKKYNEIEKKYSDLANIKCNTENKEKISAFCENIFYGLGNTLYRVGEQKEATEQKEKWQDAINAYQKTLQINPKNIWAKENIDFIQKKLSDLEKENQKDSSDNQQNNKQNSKEQSDQNSQNSKTEQNKEKNSSNSLDQENKDQQKDGNQPANEESKNNDATNQSDNQNNTNSDKQDSENQKSAATPSRLPNEIQKSLEEYQKQLEQTESQNQRFFQRNPNAAQPNQNNDPFDDIFQNDPFFQDFFGDDPMMQQFFGNQRTNFNKNLPNENEKDW